MRTKVMRWTVCGMVLGTAALGLTALQAAALTGPVELQVDNLKTPLGIDDPAPRFSWQLQDPARGARQTAYEVKVASRASLLDESAGKADLWDSGRIESDASMNIPYAGPELAPSTRYFWRVKVWDAAGKPYAESGTSWWETGLVKQANWQGIWIGFETPEEDAVRHADAQWIANPDAKSLNGDHAKEHHYMYRTTVNLTKPVRKATLYATGEDTVAGWVNGTNAIVPSPYPAWHIMPWKRYAVGDATLLLVPGDNVIGVEVIHYGDFSLANDVDVPPMMATLFVEYTDGSTATFGSGPEWKTALYGNAGWMQTGADPSDWKNAVAWKQALDDHGDPLGQPWIPDSVKALRHTFTVDAPVKSARLYATSLGAYEMFLNGKRVGEDVLAPGWTDYRQHVKYQTYDVTALLAKGNNAIGALLAPGWYQTSLEWYAQPNNYGDTPPALKAQLRIEHTDGSVEWVATGAQWQANRSAIEQSQIYDGESQDARKKQPGWDTAGFDAAGWKSALAIEPKQVAVEAQDYPSIRVERTLAAKSMNEPKPGVYVYDMGQNFAGVERLRVEGPAGTDVRLRFAEILNADGTIYTDNLRNAKATDHFILDGKGMEEFTPQFTFHGYRYVELTGLPTAPAKDAVTGLVIHTDAPFTIKLETGDAMINQLWKNILWGQRSNFISVPTDCPQRDERLGWMADAQVFWRAAGYNMDLAAFTRKYAEDARGTQSGTPYYGIFAPGVTQQSSDSAAAWSDAGVIIPWTSWLQTGDTSVIEQNWAAMEKYLKAIADANPDWLWVHENGNNFGDWLSPEGKTDFTLLSTAYWAYDVTLMRQMAHAMGRTADEEKYGQQFESIRAAFQKEFIHADGFIAGAEKDATAAFSNLNNPDARSKDGATETGYVLALHMNLVPENLRAAAAKKLAERIEANHNLLGTGFVGTRYLLDELAEAGYTKLAYSLLLNTQYPSWGYMVEHGATTMWERWNGDKMLAEPEMNSFNHYAYGAVAAWIYSYAAGVDATTMEPGFHTVVLHPAFDARMGHVAIDYDSAYGPIHSDWKVNGATAEWHVTIPANTTGRLKISAEKAAKYKLEGVPLSESKLATVSTHGQQSGYDIAAGSYNFVVDLQGSSE